MIIRYETLKSLTAKNHNYDDIIKSQIIETERPIELSHDPEFEDDLRLFLIGKINKIEKFTC